MSLLPNDPTKQFWHSGSVNSVFYIFHNLLRRRNRESNKPVAVFAGDMGANAFAYKGDPPDHLLSAIRIAYNQRGESRQE
jgi:hypothetical protein